MVDQRSCPICMTPKKAFIISSPVLKVYQCMRCGHCRAEHVLCDPKVTAMDCHAQYEQNTFVAALQKTRERQARDIIKILRQYAPGADGILDFGCGRGWFLKVCIQSGFKNIAGADTSELAIKWLNEAAVQAMQLVSTGDGKKFELPFEQLSFKPEVLVLLDVIEHFSCDALAEQLEQMMAKLNPKWVVIKVPVTGGLLYRFARIFSYFGFHRVLEKMYLVGTFPPHNHYFSGKSLMRFLHNLELDCVVSYRDPDFEYYTLFDRAQVFQGWPRVVTSTGGMVALLLSKMFGIGDSCIVLAKPKIK